MTDPNDYMVILPGNVARFEPPEGMEAYTDGDTVRFRPIRPNPADLLGIEVKVVNARNQKVLYEAWMGARWEPQIGDRHSLHLASLLNGSDDDPMHRNPRSFRRVEVSIAHPDEAWVKEATALLQDYLDHHLADLTEDHMTRGEDG